MICFTVSGKNGNLSVRAGGRPATSEVRPNVGATLATSLADELLLDIRQPHMIGSGISRQGGRVAAPIVAAEDVDAEGAGLPHLSEGDLLFAWHAAA